MEDIRGERNRVPEEAGGGVVYRRRKSVPCLPSASRTREGGDKHPLGGAGHKGGRVSRAPQSYTKARRQRV